MAVEVGMYIRVCIIVLNTFLIFLSKDMLWLAETADFVCFQFDALHPSQQFSVSLGQ